MKFIAIAAAGLIAAAGVTPVPAEAQRHGYGYGPNRGWHAGPGWRGGPRGWRGDRRGWRGDRRWRGGRGWAGGPGFGRSRVRCTVVRGWYGPQRQCFRVFR